MLNIPNEIAAAYINQFSQRSQVVGASHNEQATIYHVFTVHGLHDRWALVDGKWKRTDSKVVG